ncbi:uncharacterized protein LOC110973761 [Acanthaster planci]|uniref:Uncharacterized protein LOC110973761 n=1 Tax=Acanthaster planci TaxID=133434 RepID=A0A8B7XKQ7_ACAPL|nr:uncharacterized protein LOC110973761 [Acanthaster planci]
MPAGPLRSQLLWLLAATSLAILTLVTAQTDPCQQQPCVNGSLCRQAYLSPGYICECSGDWQGQNCDRRFPGTSETMPKQCGTNFYTNSGTIVSPNFPQPEPHNQDCYYLVRIPSALSINLRFNTFVSEPNKDELYIFPGTEVNFNLPGVREYNGTLSPQFPAQVFNTNQLVLYWLTDFNINSPGFSIAYDIDPDPCWMNPCQNGGTCTTLAMGQGYSCACLQDFSGDDCQIGTVIVSQTTISVIIGSTLAEGRVSHPLTFDLTFSPGTTLFSLTGTGLWSVTLFLTDGANNRVVTQNIPLTSQQNSVSWQPPSSSIIRTIQAIINLNTLACPQMRSVCAMIGQGSNPTPPFSMRGTPNENALIGCTPVQCRGVEVTSVQFDNTLRTLREGVSTQSLQFSLTMSTDPQGGTVSGSNLWKITVFGSNQANGQGSQVLTSQLSLSPSQAGAGVVAGTVRFFNLQTSLSLAGIVCPQVRFFCVRVEKSNSPTPQFTLSGVPSDAVLTACQATTCRGVQVTGTTVSISSGTPLIERRSNSVAFSLSIQTDPNGGSVNGQNLFSIQTFGSNSLTGTSIRISERQIQGNTGITAGRLATIPNLSTTVNLNGQLCQQINALCTVLSKSTQANPDFTLDPVPSSAVLQECVSIECRGVYIQTMNVVLTGGGLILFGNRNQLLTFNLGVQAGSPSASIAGSGLWRLFVYANNRLDGTGPRIGQVGVMLTSGQQNSGISANQLVNFNNLQVTMDLSSVTSCANIIYLCVELQKGLTSIPDFTLEGSTVRCLQVQCAMFNPCQSNPCRNGATCNNVGGAYTCSCSNGWTGPLCSDAVNACMGIVCQNGGTCINRQFSFECQCLLGWRGTLCEVVDVGVQIITTSLSVTLGTIREYTAQNTLTLSVTLTNSQTGSSLAAGSGYWQVIVFTSQQADGLSTRFNQQTLSLNAIVSGLGITAGGTLTLSNIPATLNLLGQSCSSVPYVCIEVQKGSNPSPDFVLTGSLIACQPTNCLGVQIVNTQLRVVSTSNVRERSSSNSLTLDLIITASLNGGSVSGSRLWRLTAFLSTLPDGSGVQYSPTFIQLSDAQAGTSLQAGLTSTISSLQTNANTASNNLICGQFGYICVRLEKGLNPSVDFQLGDGTQSYVACAPVNCRGVEITDVVATILSGEPVNTETTNNILTFNVQVSSAVAGASVSGTNLWQVIIFSDTQLNGQGLTVIQMQAVLPGNTASTFLQAGVDMILRNIQVTLDLTQISCNQIPYICVRLLKSSNPSPNPDFTFTAVPSEDVLLHCQPLDCMDPSPCIGNLCENGAQCTALGSGSYRCECTPGWTGLYCNVVADYCLITQTPCFNGGQCVSLSDRYQCICPQAWVGTRCQTDNPCVPINPCFNGGTCFPDQIGGYICTCLQGFSGENCQITPDPCQSDLCQNGATCVRIGTGLDYECRCLAGYAGTYCNIALDPCDSRPCLNGGNCSQVGMTYAYQCQCPNEFTGTNCQTVRDFCSPNPCLNGGVCLRQGTSGYTCQCSLGYTGTNCATRLEPCASNPCQNGGACSRVGTNFVYQCQCVQGFTGTNCETPNACISNPCQNGGQCNQQGAGYQCQCQQGYDGLNCEIVLNPCVSSPCFNGATCILLGTNFRCQCAPGYTGTNCRTVQNPCDNNPCLNGGVCSWQGQVLVYQCQCPAGYSGNNCQLITNPCVSSPCFNRATCLQQGTDFRCQCAPGYTGLNCGTIQNPCDNNPCLNGGVCSWQGQVLVYQCQCPAGYSGNNCQLITNPCVSSPCLNGATCFLQGTDFRCQCAPGYAGTNCGTIQNPCDNNPCLNGGVCSWQGQVLVYQCQCPAGYSGNNCQLITNPCVSSPCLNGATCLLQGTDFRCQCAPGYTGTNCGTVQNPCDANPCLNGGMCNWFGQALIYQCQCLQGYSGNNCQVIQNPCNSNPCQNGGLCQWPVTSFAYTCQCTLGFTGLNCATALNPCSSNPCNNGGICSWLVPDYRYQCQCPPTHTGNNCEIPLGSCFSSPCQNGATCFNLNQGSGYFCSCPSSFKGENCQYPEPCISSPCLNGGTCSSNTIGSSFTCTCLANFQGNSCQFPNPCSSQPCQNFGICVPDNFGSSYSCTCQPGYLGDHCQFANPCISNPCFNGGQCETDNVGSRYTCSCPASFVGDRCQLNDPCLPNPCQNGAVCSLANGGQTYQCSCINGFFGQNCQIPDPCRSLPCLNGGACVTTNADPCFSLPCQNGGTCEPHPLGTSFTCSCQPDFQGALCQNRNPCASNPCLNGGACQVGIGGTSYFCNCPVQFLGPRCQNSDPCLSRPCLNGGVCTSAAQGLLYSCTCPLQYFGMNCEILDACTSSPCLNGGVCNPSSFGFTCTCAPGFNGVRCTNSDPCGRQPCQNGGSCFESTGPTGFFCRCTSGFIGATCQFPDLCSYSPCLNGGTCSNFPLGSDFLCVCPQGYSGKRCDEFNPCSSDPCLNGGTCNRDSLGQVYSCICLISYVGTNCEFGPNCFSPTDFRCGSGECIPASRQCDQSFDCADSSDENTCSRQCTSQEFRCTSGTCINIQLVCNGINECPDGLDEQNCASPCDSTPCLNSGACMNSGTNFICNCAQGWTGTTCDQVAPRNNLPPTFLNQIISINIPEDTLAGTIIYTLNAADPENDTLTFGLSDFVAQQLFIIVPNPNDPMSAFLTLKTQLDREVQGFYSFVVFVTDGSNEVIHNGNLLLSDINDNPPMFTNLPNTTTVFENAINGPTIFDVNAVDPDSGLGGIVTYSITSVSGVHVGSDALFSINQFSGVVILTGPLDYETNQVYSLDIQALDLGNNSLRTTSTLTVQVLDVQDTGPVFINTPYDRTINEGTPLNTVVVTVLAVDQDTINANNVTYEILGGNLGSFFRVDSVTGEVILVRELDRENINTPAAVELIVRAIEIGSNGAASVIETFIITINDIDDESPVFNQSTYTVSVSEAETPGFVLPVGIEVSDGEIVIQGNFRITLQNFNIVPFSISPSSAVDQAIVTLTLIRPLDYENTRSYDLQLMAEDTAISTATVVVTVIDVNDNDPIFTHGTQTIALEEGSPMGTVITSVTVTDADEGINANTEFNIIAGNQAGLFAINTITGVITTTSVIDFENSASTYTLTIEARNTQPAVSPADGVSEVTVLVTITDINDSPPVFQQPNYLIQIIELSDTGLTIGRVIANDADSGPAGEVTYTILSGNDNGTFLVDPNSGNIILLQPLDRETVSFYNITVQAQDRAAPPLSATTYVIVEVRDFNDNDPQWIRDRYTASVVEGQPANTFVIQVMAQDADIGRNALLRYELAQLSQYLYINLTTGQIFTSMPLDREQTETIEVNVRVRDDGDPRRFSSQLAVVTVTVLDINDTPPTFAGTPYRFEVAENERAGTFVGQVTAADPDSIGTLTYSFAFPQTQFLIDPTMGTITTINSLDREQQDQYNIQVNVTDGTFETTTDVLIVVTDVNDNQPVFSQVLYEVTVAENTPARIILNLMANDSDIGLNSDIIYQFDPSSNTPIGPFLLDRLTGELRTTSSLDRETQDSYTLVVNAIDREGGSGSLQAVATVLVTVTDVNDNRPVFEFQNYAESVAEDAAQGQQIVTVRATDGDTGDNAVILYRIIQGNGNNNFQINSSTGVISRGPTPLDRETEDSYLLTVEAYNDGDLPPRNTATVTITVTDVNDEAPRFTQDVYLKPDLLETAEAGTVVVTVSANDPDLGQGGEIQYSITGGNEGNYFVIDSYSGRITVLSTLPDYSIQSTYNLTVTAQDQAQPFHTATATVRVLLVDAQDDPPEFTMARYEVNLTENVGEGYPFLQVVAQVPGKPNAMVTYSLEPNVNPTILQMFDVDPVTGWLTTKGMIDYETGPPLYTFTVLGMTEAGLSGSAAVWVHIQDLNDNPPVFVTFPNGAVTVDENMAGGFVVATVAANDADSGINADVVYVISGGNEEGHFDIIPNAEEALIVTTTALDRETVDRYTLTITASDQGIPSMNSSIVVEVVVNDLNDNPPVFDQVNYTATVEENVLPNQPVTTILVTDMDASSSNNIQFQIDPASNPNGVFQINSQGEITLTTQLDRETQAFYDLTVIMTDPNYDPTFMETTHVYVTVLDQNDNQPVFPDQPSVTVTEGPSSTGVIFVTVTASDADVGNNSEMVYTITRGNGEGIFGIHSNNGSIYIINELDWETTQTYELIITATDQAVNSNDRRTGTVTVVINVEDINDTPPQFPSSYFGPYSVSEGVPGTYIGPFVAVDMDSGAGGQVTYTIIGEYSDLFIINPTTGVLTLKPTAELDYETSQEFNITIIATDAGMPSLNGTTTVGIIVINVNDNSPRFQDTPYRTSINDTSPVDAWVYKVLATDDDAGPEGEVTYSIFDGNTGGVFRIDPVTGNVFVNKTLTNGVYRLVIKAQDNPANPDNAREVTETLTILVADSTTVIPIFPNNGTFTGSVLEHSTVGTFVLTVSVENEADAGDLTYAISGQDAGPFFVNPSTGVITVNGILDAEIQDHHVFDVSAIDSRGVSANGKVNITILNINDHLPQLDEIVFNFTVPEDAGDGYYVGQVNASDDDNTNTMLRFTIERGAGDKFTIDPVTGVITVLVACRGDICDNQPLDREEQDQYILTVSVSDQGSPPLSNSGVVYIYVTDVNDFQPYFPDNFLDVVISVSEDAALNHTVTTVQAVDHDQTASLTYSIVSVTATNLLGEPIANISAIEGLFGIDPYTGTVYVSETLDRETAAQVVLTISANDSASVDPALSTSNPNAKVTIQITDVNDNPPVFQPPGTTVIVVTVQEESGMGTIITNVEAIDPDDPINGVVTYVLMGNLTQFVTIHPFTGQITVNQVIDRELYDWLNFTIIAMDSGTPSLSTSIPISIQILDVNDHNPVFNQTNFMATVIENANPGTFVIVTTATDQDIGQFGEVTYTLTGGDGLFVINSTTGVITTLQPLDQEVQSIYTLTVIAEDNPGGSQTNSRQGSTTVTVIVGNVNEHAPTTQREFPFIILEEQPGGTLVGVIDASDPDDPMQELNFTFILVEPPDGNVLFFINQTTGEIFTTGPLEADNATYGSTFNITVLISDNGSPPQTTTTTTIITIQDTNDNNPIFPNGPYDLATSEASPVGFQVTVVMAEDIDQNAMLTYRIIGGNINGTFFINPTNGEILITKPLDFETRTAYNLTVQVSDQDGRTGTTYVVINVMDANDQGPVFLRQPYLFDVYENVDLGTEIGHVEAVDADPDPSNSQLTYHILSSVPASAPFVINQTTGVITSTGILDREMQDSYMLTVEVRNTRSVPGEEDVTYKLSTPVTITILDVNDNTPVFAGGDNITRSFPENSQVDFPIYQPSAQDMDIGENSQVTYSIISGNVENTFSIDPQTGAIILARQIQSLTVPTYTFTLVIEARDNGNPSLSSNITLNAVVGDYNDNPPQFVTPSQGQLLFLPENEPIGFRIASVLAVDIDSGANGQVTYGFLNEASAKLFFFQQEGNTTYLYANFSADRETRDQYNLVLLAMDGGTPQPLQTPLEVTVVIVDKDDNEPFFLRVDNNVAIVQTLNVTEHSNVNTSSGYVTTALDLDLSPNNVIYYYIVGGNENGFFGINSTTGEIIVLGDLDRETIATHRLIIKATNNASYVPSGIYDVSKDMSLKEVEIVVRDINDNGPRFTTVLYTTGLPLDAEINTQVTCIKATDLDVGGGGAITYAIQSATFVLGQDQTTFDNIFYIDENSGCIRTRNLLNEVKAGGYFDLTVTATDKTAGLSDTALVRVFVLDTNQQVVVVVDADIDTVTNLQDQLISIIANITGGIVNVDSITYFIDSNGNTVRDQTMIVLHVIDPETNSLMDADIVLRLIDENSKSISLLFQQYGVVDVYALMGGVGGAGFGIIEIALLAIALLLFLGALIFIIILCCLQRKYLKKIHGNSPAVIYATRADANVKDTATYQGSNPLWLETEGGIPDDWPDSISLLGGGAAREYESQEASMDFFSDIHAEVAKDALVMTAMVNDNQTSSVRSRTTSNGGLVSNGRVSMGADQGKLRVVSSSAPLIMDSTNTDGSVSTLTNRINRDGSVTASLSGKDGGYSASGATYSYSTASFSGDGVRPSTSKKLTSEKAQEIRQMLDEDQGVEATFLDEAYQDQTSLAAARASYREQVEFDNQLSPITEEDTASSWSSWTRDSERSGARYAGSGTLDRNRTSGYSSKDYPDPMKNYTTSTSIEESYSRSVKGPGKSESSSFSRRANSKTYSAGVATSIGMVTLTEETPEMLEEDESETSSIEEGAGKTYVYNVRGDSSEGASSGHSATKRATETSLMNFTHEEDDADEVIEEREVRRSVKTTRGFTNSGYDNYLDEESRL